MFIILGTPPAPCEQSPCWAHLCILGASPRTQHTEAGFQRNVLCTRVEMDSLGSITYFMRGAAMPSEVECNTRAHSFHRNIYLITRFDAQCSPCCVDNITSFCCHILFYQGDASLHLCQRKAVWETSPLNLKSEGTSLLGAAGASGKMSRAPAGYIRKCLEGLLTRQEQVNGVWLQGTVTEKSNPNFTTPES